MKNVINVRESFAAKSAASALQKLFLKARFKSVLFLVSGGSSLSVLNAQKKWLLPRDMTLSLVDERLSDDSAKRNWTPFTKTILYKNARQAGKVFFNPLAQGLKKTDVRFDAFLKRWLAKHVDGEVVLVLGVGGDGHTGAIFPNKNKTRFTKDFRTPTIFAKAHRAANAPVSKRRLTVTLSFIETHADHVMVFAVGKEKNPTVRKILSGRVRESDMPAVALTKMPQTLLYTTIPR
jgi:6-phosphogluconolactonase/glucosamine-6-phosphate isomerase/deaminase